MKRFLVFLIIVSFLGGGVFLVTKKPQVKSFFLSLKERPTEPEEAFPPVAKPGVEKKVPVAKVELVMRKIDTDGDGVPDTFVMKGGPGSAPAASGEIPEGLGAGYCYYVADGDTIYVKLRDGTKDKIRLVGIDTPEVKHGKRGKDEPGGQEAKKFVMERCLEKMVFLDIDDESPIDYYGRTLALVYPANTSYKVPRNSLNAVLLRKGYAKVLYIPPSEFNPYSW